MFNSSVDEIKNRLDIVSVIGGYIKLQKAGANYRAVCPFHSEKSPSFFVSPSKQIWHCFGSCSEGGDMFKFVMKIEGVEFKDALKILADKAGIAIKKEAPEITTKRQKAYDICNTASFFFKKQLESSSGKEVREYLKKRGLKDETIEKWNLGYSPFSWQSLSDFLVGKGYKREEIEEAGLSLKSEKGRPYDRFRGRIMFPIFDGNSRVVGFGARIFKEKESSGAKYVNTPSTIIYDKSRTLYGIDKASLELRRRDACFLVEGYLDTLMVYQEGFENVVAVSGTSLTPYHLRIIKRYTDNLYTAFDMDTAGESATRKGIQMATEAGFNVKVITMDEGFDPADIVRDNPKKWEEMVKGAKPMHDFYFDTTLSKFDKNTLEGKKMISKELFPVIKKLPDKIEQDLWLKDLVKILGVKEESILEEFLKTREEPFLKEEEKEELKKQKKTKKEILEEYLLYLLFQLIFDKSTEEEKKEDKEEKEEKFTIIKEEDIRFFSTKTTEIVSILIKDPKKIKEINIEEISALIIKAEIEKISNCEKEIEKCLNEIKKDFYKKELEDIALKIREEEENKSEEKIEKLKNEFSNLLKLFNELEN